MKAMDAVMQYVRTNTVTAFRQSCSGRVDLEPAHIGPYIVCGPTSGCWQEANGCTVIETVPVGGWIGEVQVAVPDNRIERVFTRPSDSQYGNLEQVAIMEDGTENVLDTYFSDERGPAVESPEGMSIRAYQRRRDAWMVNWIRSWR